MVYRVAIAVNYVYHIDVGADSPESAADLAEKMQTTHIREHGKLVDVETSVVEVRPMHHEGRHQ